MPIILSPVGSSTLSWQLVQVYVEDGLHSWVHHSMKIKIQAQNLDGYKADVSLRVLISIQTDHP